MTSWVGEDGAEPDKDPKLVLEAAEDQLPPGDERPGTVNRTFTVDRSNPETPAVHVWLYTM